MSQVIDPDRQEYNFMMQDPMLDDILLRFPKLRVKTTQYEYRVFRSDEEGKGSLWIARQRDGYRVVTTGTAHSIDGDIEQITGNSAREMSDRAHKWWKSLSNNALEKVFRVFAEN